MSFDIWPDYFHLGLSPVFVLKSKAQTVRVIENIFTKNSIESFDIVVAIN